MKLRIVLAGIVGAVLFAAMSAGQVQAKDTQAGEFVYKTVGKRELKIYVDYPADWKAADRRGVIVFFFGGGWTGGSVKQFEVQAAYFASRGLVAARADYRVKGRDRVTPDKCVEDAGSAVRWIRKNAGTLGVDPAKLIASGGSAGGHLAACTMIAKSVDDPKDDLTISTIPTAMVLFNPVLNMADKRVISRLGKAKPLARKISPIIHLDKKTPPALIMFGTGDGLKIHGDEYWAKAGKLGVRADEYLAEGQSHGFFNRSPWRERTLVVADKFLASLGLLKGEPTVKAPASQPNAPSRRGARDAGKLMARWMAMDADKDAKVTEAEARGKLKANFKRLDTDKDGFLDKTELEAIAKRRAGRRQGAGKKR